VSAQLGSVPRVAATGGAATRGDSPGATTHAAVRDATTALERRILARIDAEQVADLTAKLIGAASENPGGSEDAAVEVLNSALRAAGARTARQNVHPGRPNLVARMGQGTGGVLFLGHSDVVPAGVGWTADPFTARRRDGLIIGRGATDMKGGLAAVTAAMAAVHAELPDVSMTLLCTVDEEADATGIRHHIATTAPEHYAACVAAEPTGMVAITGCRGAINLRIDVHGASAHAGRPTDGASAILGAADVIAAIEADGERLASAADPVLGCATWSVGTITGGHGTSIVPDRCTLTIDRRTLPGEDPERILVGLLTDAHARIAARTGGDRISVSGAVEMVMPGFSIDRDSATVEVVCDALRAAGGTGRTGVWTAACEGGFIAEHNRVPTLVLGPGDVATQAHQPDESVAVDDLAAAARAYALIAVRLYRPSGEKTP
jgi:acetylornithine deacetylase